MYAVDATVPDIEAAEVPWATVTREIKSAKIDGQFNLDVVNSAALDDYLKERVHLFSNAVARLAEENPQRFVTHEDLTYVRAPD